MAKTKTTNVGFSTSFKPKKISDKRSKVYGFTIPKFGRFAFSNDPGEANLFFREKLSTNLGAIVRQPDGKIIDEIDLGSGLITNIGVTAMANDPFWTIETPTENLNTLSVQKFVQWGTGVTAEQKYNWKLQTPAENETKGKEGVTATQTFGFLPTGNAKLTVTAELEAKGTVAITEWGLFSAAKIEGEATKNSTSNTTTTLTDTAKLSKPGETASAVKVRGAQQYILETTEPEIAYGLILKNTTEVATVPGFIKNAAAETAAEPKQKTPYFIKPVMWDHRVFSVISLEKGNKIQFPYELTIES